MWISGTGITPFEAKIKPDFKPKTTLAIKWFQTSDGNWRGTDRGSSSDLYQAEIRLYNHKSEIDAFEEQIELNRSSSSNVVTMSDFSATEHIFGEDVNHFSPISVTILEIDRVKQKTWKGYGLDLTVQCPSPTFTGSTSLPTFKCLSVGYGAGSKRTISKLDSYEGDFEYIDHNFEAGIFEGTLIFSIDGMRSFRNYVRTNRTNDFIIPDIYGVESPFGVIRGTSYPITAKLIEWEDLGMYGVNKWRVKVKFAEVIS